MTSSEEHLEREAGVRIALPVPIALHSAASDWLHPGVYGAIVALACLLVGSVWGFFAEDDVGYVLAVVSGFVFASILIPFQLWRIHRRYGQQSGNHPRATIIHWLAGDFDTWQARVKSREAAIEILLPIAAVAFGMAAFAIALHVAVG